MKLLTFSGRLAADAVKVESKIPGGDPFISFTVCVNEKSKDTETVDYIRVSYHMSGIFEYLKKGQSVIVYGKPSFRIYNPKEGEPQVEINVRAENISLN